MPSAITDPDDPNRCQGMMSNGQCTMVALPNQKFCKMHIVVQQRTDNKRDVRNLNLSIWQNRVNQLADSPKVKSLREEIGILRLLLESVVNNCRDTTDLISMSNKVSDLVARIERIVGSCHNLEKSSGLLLDKNAALQLASSFISIVGELCSNPDEVAAIADKMIDEVAKTKALTPTKK